MTEIAQAPAAPAARSASPWLRFAARRLGQLLVSALVLVTASFLIIHLVPGDPVRAALGLDASQQLVDARRAQLGLDNPLWLQYADYLRNLLAGRLGTSITSGLPVSAVELAYSPISAVRRSAVIDIECTPALGVTRGGSC